MVEDYYKNSWVKRAGELELKDQIGTNQKVYNIAKANFNVYLM